MRFALWLGNFACLGLCTAYWAGLAAAGVEPSAGQKSIVMVLICVPASVWVAKRLWSGSDNWNAETRDFLLLCSFIFPASAANFVFSPAEAPGFVLEIPFMGMLWAKIFTRESDSLEEMAEGFLTLLCQIAAAGLVLRVSSFWPLSLAAGLLACGAGYWAMGRSRPGFLIAFLSPLTALWFFLNLSNQLVNSYPVCSRAVLIAGVIVYLGLIVLGLILAKNKSPKLKVFNRACLIVFALSLITEVDVEAGMATPLFLLDFHWWIHVAPGLDAVYDTMKPYVHYIPFEGFIFETMLPRLWFVGLNQTMGGFFMLMAGFCFASQALFLYLVYAFLIKILGAARFSSALLACAMVITNLSLIGICYPFPGAWTIAERSLVCFVCALLFFRLYEKGGGPRFAALVGGVHAFSFFYEPFFGLAGLCALAGVMIFSPGRVQNKISVAAGIAGVIAAFIIVFRIPLYMFFIHQPFAMLNSGGALVKLGEGRHLFMALFREHTLSVFHYLNALGAMLVFTGILPTRARRHRLFGLALYLFIATFFMMISGGQRFFGEPDGTFSTVHFAAMASVLAVPLWICLIRIILDSSGLKDLDKNALARICLSAAVLIAFTDGVHKGLAPGSLRAGISERRFEATAWDDQIHYQAPFSNSVPVILKYYFDCKSRRYIATGPAPLSLHYQPYDQWKDEILPMQPIQDIRAFISHSRMKRE